MRPISLFAVLAFSSQIAWSGYCPFTITNYNAAAVKMYFDSCGDCSTIVVAGNGGTNSGTIGPTANAGAAIAYSQDANNDFNCAVYPQEQGFTMIIGVDGQCTITKFLDCNVSKELLGNGEFFKLNSTKIKH